MEQCAGRQPRLLLVANVAKEHVLKFHVPTIKMLKEKGWYVDVACAGDEPIPYCDHQYRMSYKRSPFNLALLRGIGELKDIIRTGHYDIVYCHTPVGGLAARIAARTARRSGTKVVYMAHGYHFFKGAPLVNWLVYYPVEKILSGMTDAIIVPNQEDYARTKRCFRGCDAYLINGIGVDFNKFRIEDRDTVRRHYRDALQIPQDATVLIYLAELLTNKNQTFLMRVLKKLMVQEKNVYLVLVGFDHSDRAFEYYADQLAIHDHVRFLGWREDVGNLYAMADICTASSIREGFGLNLVEAMYSGIPVVATRNRGHVCIVRDGENGYLVDLNDEDTFAQRILTLMHDPQLRARFVETGRAECGRFSSEAALREIESILERYR